MRNYDIVLLVLQNYINLLHLVSVNFVSRPTSTKKIKYKKHIDL